MACGQPRCYSAKLMVVIDAMDFRGVDLNLLVSLRVLLVERHVTRSAERLGITQPATSASLARLRTLFRDQLLVRGPKGLVLTPRAEQLLEQINHVMADIEQMIAPPAEFVAETSQRTFTLIGTDFVELILLPSLMAAVATEAPNLQVLFRTPDPKNIEGMMASGELDLAVGYLPEAPEELIKRTVFREPFVCVARRGHPLLHDGTLPLDRYVELQHVQVLPRDGAMYGVAIDTALVALGLVRKVALWEPSFLAVASVVAETDLISTVPTRVATHVAQGLPITIYDLPLPLPGPDFAIYWHPRSQDDSGHKWLRERVTALLRT
jgi:DNA-binding transcriptional LysR family regulator